MNIEEVLHMAAGDGPTSYASNSRLQKKAILQTKPLIEEAIEHIRSSILHETLVVADLGCSSGPNTFEVMSNVLDAISKGGIPERDENPEIQFYLNDLSRNDFNGIFVSLDSYNKRLKNETARQRVQPRYYVAGVPGTFYGRLFPRRRVHLFHSSYSLQWLSQVPPGLKRHGGSLNKRDIYITERSPTAVQKLYLDQFSKDFAAFLKSRSEEIAGRGRMILSFLGRESKDPTRSELCFTWGLLAEALSSMVEEGLVQEEKLNSFDLPTYIPSMDEVKLIIKNEGSFELVQAQTLKDNCDPFDDSSEENVVDIFVSAQNIANCIRAVIEPLLAEHFGDEIIDDVFSRYKKNMAKHLARKKAKYVVLVLVLRPSFV